MPPNLLRANAGGTGDMSRQMEETGGSSRQPYAANKCCNGKAIAGVEAHDVTTSSAVCEQMQGTR